MYFIRKIFGTKYYCKIDVQANGSIEGMHLCISLIIVYIYVYVINACDKIF